MVEYREMREEDLDEVCKLEEATFSMPWRRQDFADMIVQDHLLYIVAVFDNIIVGGCGLRNIVGEGEITNVTVARVYRNQGIGTDLVEYILQRGCKMGITAFTLEVRKSNLAAIHLYEKLGFVTEGLRTNFYEKPCEDAVIMGKR